MLYPIRPLEGFVTTRTGSRCSRVGPAVTTTCFPNHGARRPSSRAAAASTAAGRLLGQRAPRSEEHTSELQSRSDLVCRLLLEKKKRKPRPASKQAGGTRDEDDRLAHTDRHALPTPAQSPRRTTSPIQGTAPHARRRHSRPSSG